ncbi:ABC transporter permease [Paracoccus onubensis]|uniref:ABC transporter permease n=1 Tax=Paracoccus onubensis TaxID=1675788 RepID=UPI00272F4621|nr:ABC transporter permease [Paracoccus onubensis]MDP0928667.1 ABC transporter permease [Paracoccus onubensis]
MSGSGFISRLIALTRKETRQMLRDRSNLVVGLLLPLVLILLFGYGLSFDVTDARVAVVLEDSSPITLNAVAGLEGTDYLSPIWLHSMPEAEAMIRAGEAEAILRVPAEFTTDLAQGRGTLQLILNGVDSNTSQSIDGYATGAISNALEHLADRSDTRFTGSGVTVVTRTWFNEAGNSTWFLVPGLIVLVMTLVGAFLTSLLIAREWERGTLESLFVTPVRPLELVLSKLAPYLIIGAIDLIMCLLAARYLFEVPMRGSLWLVVLSSMLYLLVSLGLGLWISGVTRNQFAASQMALLISFMPAMMLSGFVFDLRNVPVAVQVISQALPATHFMSVIKTLFLAGDYWPTVIRGLGILTCYAAVLIWATHRTLAKRLD